MFGQLCVAPDELPDELPGLAEVDGDALAEGDALAACATANVPKPPLNARPAAITTLAVRLLAHARLLIFCHLLFKWMTRPRSSAPIVSEPRRQAEHDTNTRNELGLRKPCVQVVIGAGV